MIISIGIFVVSHAAFAEDTASFAKINVVYHSSTNIIGVTGVVYKTFSQNYALTIFDPQGRLIFVSQPQLSQDNTFSQSIVPSSALWSESGGYTVKMASGPQVLADKSFYFPGTSCCVQNSQGVQAGPSETTNAIDSPLKQFNSGVLSKFVKCNYDLNLLINTHNFQPVCVKEASIARLLNQGWNLPNQCVTGPVDAHFTMDVLGMVVIPKNASDVNAGKSYEPQNTTVVIGLNNTVEWFNMDDFGSSVTSDDGIFDSGLILPDHTWKYKFECAGKYEYHNVSYPWLKGAVTVLPFG